MPRIAFGSLGTVAFVCLEVSWQPLRAASAEIPVRVANDALQAESSAEVCRDFGIGRVVEHVPGDEFDDVSGCGAAACVVDEQRLGPRQERVPSCRSLSEYEGRALDGRGKMDSDRIDADEAAAAPKERCGLVERPKKQLRTGRRCERSQGLRFRRRAQQDDAHRESPTEFDEGVGPIIGRVTPALVVRAPVNMDGKDGVDVPFVGFGCLTESGKPRERDARRDRVEVVVGEDVEFGVHTSRVEVVERGVGCTIFPTIVHEGATYRSVRGEQRGEQACWPRRRQVHRASEAPSREVVDGSS